MHFCYYLCLLEHSPNYEFKCYSSPSIMIQHVKQELNYTSTKVLLTRMPHNGSKNGDMIISIHHAAQFQWNLCRLTEVKINEHHDALLQAHWDINCKIHIFWKCLPWTRDLDLSMGCGLGMLVGFLVGLLVGLCFCLWVSWWIFMLASYGFGVSFSVNFVSWLKLASKNTWTKYY